MAFHNMLVLIAESKTMTSCSETVSIETYNRFRPLFEDLADEIMYSLRSMNASELSEKVNISPALAGKLVKMIYEFPNKSLGSTAIESFTGVVFRAFDYSTLSEDCKKRTDEKVRIVSSLYGWLRPDDIVKQYRFDFTTALAPGGLTFASYWRNNITECLLSDIKASSCGDIINMLPGDAARCFDWKRIGLAANVRKVDFRELQPGGGMKTPTANRLKTLRGLLLRRIITENIDTVDALSRLESDFYIGDGLDSDGNIVFICEK